MTLHLDALSSLTGASRNELTVLVVAEFGVKGSVSNFECAHIAVASDGGIGFNVTQEVGAPPGARACNSVHISGLDRRVWVESPL